MRSWTGCEETARECRSSGCNPLSIEERLERLQGCAAVRGERAVLVIDMPREAPSSDSASPTDRADRIAALLGTENERLLHDVREGLDPAELAAAIGTIPRGGALLLLVAPAHEQRVRSDRRFARQLDALLRHLPTTGARIELPGTDHARLRALCVARFETRSDSDRPVRRVPAASVAAQDALFDQLVTSLGHGSHNAIAITAARGRGKSALLGRLAAHLQRSATAYTVTAAHRAATEALQRHRYLALTSDGLSPVSPGPLPFLAPDAALARRGDVLLVDEAASLPLPHIDALLSRYARVVLASTSEGHESAGRAFALRLPALLERRRPGAWSTLTPREPLRWQVGDPLETFVADALLPSPHLADLQTMSTTVDATDDAKTSAARVTVPGSPSSLVGEIDRDALIDDERRLAAVFGLLAATHYQSSPLDLTHLLDSPTLRLWSLERDDAVLGVALVAIESGVPQALHADILAGRRRPPHALLPQLLARCADDSHALGATFARVTRIAVHPARRRRGIGRALLDAIRRDTADRVEALGASFAASPDALAFWRANGFTPFHSGFRRNPRSGLRSAAVLRADSPRTMRVLARAVAIHHDNERSGTPHDAHRDTRLLRRFIDGERSAHDTRGALRRLVLGADADASADAVPTGAESTGGVNGASTDADDVDELSPLLAALGIAAPASRAARERRLREALGTRL